MYTKISLSLLLSTQCLFLVHCFTIFNTREMTKKIVPQTDGSPPIREIPLSLSFKHKATEEFVKRLEYAANVNDVNSDDYYSSLDLGLVPIDLNLLPDEIFAGQIVDGIEEELAVIETEIGETSVPVEAIPEEKEIMTVSQMNHGFYISSPEHNTLIDGLIRNVKRDFRRRKMDPLYFSVGDSGAIRHTKTNKESPSVAVPAPQGEQTKRKATFGGGVILGLRKLKRFGNAESRKEGEVTLVRSHFFFGPLDIDLVFENNRGLRIVNSTLPHLAAHALFEVSGPNNTLTLKEFITDNPMEHEIRLAGTKNKRFQSLGRAAVMRLFRRDSRMETRMLRSFIRAASRQIRAPTTTEDQKPRRKTEKLTSGKNRRTKDDSPLL